MNRDLDLVAIPWSDDLKSEQDMIMEFQCYLLGHTVVMPEGGVDYTILPGNRHSYVIDFNRGNKRGEWVRYEDEQYYLDISVCQLASLKSEAMEKSAEEIIKNMNNVSDELLHTPFGKAPEKITDEMIEKWAYNECAFPSEDGDMNFNKILYEGLVQGAKAMRDGLIK